MNQRVVGIILIIFGGYLVIGNTFFSLLFNYAGPIGFHVPMSPVEYWQSWWMLYGPMTLLVAGTGVFLVYLGIHVLRNNKKKADKDVLIAPQPQA